jgi:hypothetical protein
VSDTTTSTNMSMPIPIVGQDPGPNWATDYNSCLTIIDQHDHTPGYGVAITPSGLNINSDLPFQNNDATTLRSVRFTAQVSPLAAPSDIGCLYESGVDLYYNDANGNQIRITQSGGISGTSGSIAGLTSPAAATYVAGSKSFIWQSGTNKAAAMDNGAVIIRETDVASAKGVTIASPTSLAADYQLTLPAALPGSTQYFTSTSGGSMSFTTANGIATAMTSTGADAIAATMTSTGANAIAATMTSTGTGSLVATATAANANTLTNKVTRSTGTTVGTQGVAISTSCGTFSTSSTSLVDVTNLSVTITTSGRPVFVGLISDGTGSSTSASHLRIVDPGSQTHTLGYFALLRDSTQIAYTDIQTQVQSVSTTLALHLPPSSVFAVDAVAAGTYTYKMQVAGESGTTFTVALSKLVAYEL